MRIFIDLKGKKFGKWTVIKVSEQNKRYWLCKCICGKEKMVHSSNLKSGRTTSCGCPTYLSRQPIGKIWDGIKTRCYNTTDIRYKNYGARGIKMSIEWKKNRKAFVDWAIASGYKEGLTIERKDNEKGYYPENCCWISLEEQSYNRRNTTWVIWKGKKTSLAKLAKNYGVLINCITKRINRGWSLEKALSKPSRNYHKSKLF